MSEIKYHLITVDESTVALAEKIIDNGVLKKKNLDDCQHISAAILSNCDIIISWNYNHIVNVKTIRGSKVITTVEGYKDLLIYPPSALLSEEEWQMDEIKKPDVSPRFDVDDIRKIRDYNSQRHSKMTRKEIVEDIRKGAEEVIKKYGLNVTYAQKLN